MNPENNAQLLEQSLIQLTGDDRFKRYIESIEAAKESCIEDLCNDEVIESERKTLAAIGALRTYQDILDNYNAVKNRVAQ